MRCNQWDCDSTPPPSPVAQVDFEWLPDVLEGRDASSALLPKLPAPSLQRLCEAARAAEAAGASIAPQPTGAADGGGGVGRRKPASEVLQELYVAARLRESDEQPQLKSLYEGVTMTEKMLVKTFEEHGLKRIWPMDEKFDPNVHNALFEIPDPNKEPGTVAHVASAGYVLHDRVIRAAGVGVVKAP